MKDYTDSLIESVYQSADFGIDIFAETFNPTKLIDAVNMAGGVLRLYGANLTAYDNLMTKIVLGQDNYDDGYSKNIDFNVITKLNGIGWENYVQYYSGNRITRKSSAIFTTKKDYENEADFKIQSYKIGDTTIPEQPLEVKNFYDIASVATARTHRSLYVLANDRENDTFKLLCKLTAKDRELIADQSSPNSLETYGNYKVIKPWFWLKPLADNYNEACMGYSWDIKRGVDETGNYIEFISPRLSNKKQVTK